MGGFWDVFAVPLALLIFIALLLSFKFYSEDVECLRQGRSGRNGMGVKFDDAVEATDLLSSYLNESLDGSGRKHEEINLTGCDSCSSIRKSKDVAKFIELVHRAGCRVVVRKYADEDIECSKNTKIKVQKMLTDLDVNRSCRVGRKYRR